MAAQPMAATNAPVRVRRRRSRARRLILLPIKLLLWFVLISVLWVLLYRFVNPPITFTQLGDAIGGNGVNRQWMSIDRIDRDMIRAVIAGEDSTATLPRGTRIRVGTAGPLERILFGPAHVTDGTENLVGALRQSMAALGARTLAEMQRVEMVYAPSVAVEGKSWQRGR